MNPARIGGLGVQKQSIVTKLHLLGALALAVTAAPLARAQAPDDYQPAPFPVEPAPDTRDEPASETRGEPDPAATEEPAPDVPAPPDSVEPPTCGGRAHAVARSSVVRVRSGNTWGSGFVYPSPRHVVTAFGVVSLGQGVTVVTDDGARIPARVVARDEAFGVAVLETDAEIPGATPVEPAPETSALVGQPVVALGHPTDAMAFALGPRGEGLFRGSVTQGHVGAVNDEGLQADLTLRPGHAGSPLLDCEGRVVGAVGSGGIGPGLTVAARTTVLDALLRDAQPGTSWMGELRLRFGIGALLYIDDQGRLAAGGYLTLGATLFDRLSWMNRVGLLAGVSEPVAPADLAVDRRLVRVESLLGWRFFVDIGGFTSLYIVPAIGLSVVHETRSVRSVTIDPVPGCTPDATNACVAPRIVQSSVASWHVRPALGLTVIVGGGLELGYTFELDVEDPITTFHGAHLGLQM
jgi:S1-C subfamily serine protease